MVWWSYFRPEVGVSRALFSPRPCMLLLRRLGPEVPADGFPFSGFVGFFSVRVFPVFTHRHHSETSVNVFSLLLSVVNEHLCAWCKRASGTWLFAWLCHGCYGLSLPFNEDSTKIVLLFPSCMGKLYAL